MPFYMQFPMMLLITFGSGCADKIVLHPSTHELELFGAQRQEIRWDNGVVEVLVSKSPGAAANEPKAYMLNFNGNGSRAEWAATYLGQRWGDRAVESWTMNYPGYGRSTGPASLHSIGPAALAVYDAIQRQANGKPVYVGGNSLGTAVALHVAAHRPVAGLMLQSPPALQNLLVTKFGWWNMWLLAVPVAMQIPSDLDSIANAKKCTAPAVFILTNKDGFVVINNQLLVRNAYAGPVHMLELHRSDHNAAAEYDDPAGFNLAMDWLLTNPAHQMSANAP